MTELHLVVPEGIDDPARPSGGNRYDRRVATGLSELGWVVTEHPVSGGWPRPSTADLAGLDRLLGALPDHARVVVDGLIGSAAAAVLTTQSGRLALATLVHLPLGVLGDASVRREEAAALRQASRVVATSRWTRRWLAQTYRLGAVEVVEPGTDPAPVTAGSAAGGRLLTIAPLSPEKGADLLATALGRLGGAGAPIDSDWRLTWVGSPEVDPRCAEEVRRLLPGDRVRFTGALPAELVGEQLSAADLVVVPSRVETFGMVVTEALARGIPVVATGVGGLPETMRGSGTRYPGAVVPAEDPDALAAALRRWLNDPGVRARWRAVALDRRSRLAGWGMTCERLSAILGTMEVAR